MSKKEKELLGLLSARKLCRGLFHISLAGVLGCIGGMIGLYYRFHEVPRLLIIGAVFYFDLSILFFMLSSALANPRALLNKENQPPTRVGLDTANPPAARAAEAHELISSSNRALAFALLILCALAFVIFRYPVIRYPYNYIGGFSAITCLVLSWLSMKWRKKSELLSRPIPLTSWTRIFSVSGHDVDIAFQMPPEFNKDSVRDRIQIATKVALRNFKEESLQEIIESALVKDVRELEIPVFRVQILTIDKKAVPSAIKSDPSVYI